MINLGHNLLHTFGGGPGLRDLGDYTYGPVKQTKNRGKIERLQHTSGGLKQISRDCSLPV